MNTLTQLYRLVAWYLFTEVKCAWCKPHSTIRSAWLWPRSTTHGMCAKSFGRIITTDAAHPVNPVHPVHSN